jgi:hypothetical protein
VQCEQSKQTIWSHQKNGVVLGKSFCLFLLVKVILLVHPMSLNWIGIPLPLNWINPPIPLTWFEASLPLKLIGPPLTQVCL